MSSENTPVQNLFWTGGWDSTFHTLQLVAQQRTTIQPHYVLDEDRRSLRAELKAMRKLRSMITEQYPDAENLILPTRYAALSEINDNELVSNAYRHLKARFPALGTQYEWMAKYCKQEEIDAMHVCAEKAISESGPAHVHSILAEKTSAFYDQGTLSYRVPCDEEDQHIVALFGSYTFPLLDMTKLEMAKLSNENQWNEIMFRTWFCHTPTRRGKPCGQCNPCLQVAVDGLGRRLPLKAKVAGLFSKGY